MATIANSPNMGPKMIRTSNTPLYWGVAILAAIIIVLAFLMRPTRTIAPANTSNVGLGTTAQAVNTMDDTTPPTNARSYTTDPTTGAIVQPDPAASIFNNIDVNGMAVDPRAEQLHNGANSTNGGINPTDKSSPGKIPNRLSFTP